MSLISTSSKQGQEAYLYENHYPQPIVVEPNSQICLQKFIHYRGALYEVSIQNNTIGFKFGTDTSTDVPRFVQIPTGSYEGAQLADALALALNSVNQQQNYEWSVNFIPAPSVNDFDKFQITFASVPTPTPAAGVYNSFSSAQISITGEGETDSFAVVQYNGTNADHAANVISKRSTLVYLGSQTFQGIQPNRNTERFQPEQMGFVRSVLSNPANVNPNLQFNPDRYDLSFKVQGENMQITYGRRNGNKPTGSLNWFTSDVRRDLSALFDEIFKPAGTFLENTRLQVIMHFLAPAQTTRRLLVQLLKRDAGDAGYSPITSTTNSPINGKPLVVSRVVGGETYAGCVFDSGFADLNDTDTAIQNYPNLAAAPFFPAMSFQKAGNTILTGYALDSDDWENNAQTSTCTFTELTGNTNGYNWRTNGTLLDDVFWKQLDPLTFVCMQGDVPLTDPPTYTALLDPTAGNINPNGQIVVRDGTTNNIFRTINFTGAAPVAEETDKKSIITQGIFNPVEPVVGLTGQDANPSPAGTNLVGADLSSNAKMFLRGVGGGIEADVGNLLGFSYNESEFGGGAMTGGSITSDQEPDQTANNNTLHISIPEMPLVKSFEGENSAEAKSISIIPREEFATGEQQGSLVYVAPFENWIDINNGQELNMNLLTTIVRNADGSLAENLVRETQAVFKIRQDPMKLEEERKAEKFKEMAEMMANTINTGLTSLIKPQQLIGS